MYKKNKQVSLFNFDMSAAQLDPKNFWCMLADMVKWDEIEENYSINFGVSGKQAISSRIAVGALMVKRITGFTDEMTVRVISENPYIQYFIGLKSFTTKCPFSANTMSKFRNRIDDPSLFGIDDLVSELTKK